MKNKRAPYQLKKRYTLIIEAPKSGVFIQKDVAGKIEALKLANQEFKFNTKITIIKNH